MDGSFAKIKKCLNSAGGISDGYNGHYRTHGILTQLLVDFDGHSVMLASHLKRHSHAANIATYITAFKKVLGLNLLWEIQDSRGVSWVVAGFKPSQIKRQNRLSLTTLAEANRVA